MTQKLVPMEDVILWLETEHPELQYEIERNWVWIITDLSPVHKNKCVCEECTRRASIRRAIGRDGMGFIFAFAGHDLPSGEVGHWAHHCETPIRFKRRGTSRSPDDAAQQEPVSDDQLLQMIG